MNYKHTQVDALDVSAEARKESRTHYLDTIQTHIDDLIRQQAHGEAMNFEPLAILIERMCDNECISLEEFYNQEVFPSFI